MGIVKQEITFSLTGVIFLASLFIVLLSHLGHIDFGIIGILAWIVVIFGMGYFIIRVIVEFIGR